MKIPKIRPAPGSKNLWILVEPWFMAHNDITRTIPAGFTFNLASIPKVLRSFAQVTDRRNWPASLEHDFRYRYKLGPRKKADLEFYRALKEGGVSKAKSFLMYLAVRVGGRWTWGSSR